MMLRPSEALRIAEGLGLRVPEWSTEPTIKPPAYVKADVPLPHKSDVGAVIRVEDEEELKRAYANLVERFGAAIVQREVKGKVELLVSSKNDDVFGKVLVLAFGGLLASLVKEAVVTPCPLCENVLKEKLRYRKLGKVLFGYRKLKLDLDCLFDSLNKLCNSELKLLEVNPLVLGERGCWAVDVKAWK